RAGSIGLGLYIAREIVTGHGGTITANSSAETGTVFTVNLPRHRPNRVGQ
ncbi:MAG: two component transcriptional regulator, sensor histidine kinase, partial [Phycisphaerales bacterium]|nr:two component transcriptional regulator, sensor histidine kinase [Phycisphaerales bacterium]